jgi:mono/diheme cytochrome c family protein
VSKVGWILLGAVAVVALEAAAARMLLVLAGGFSAREEPPAMERWIARQARSGSVPPATRNLINPAPNTPEVLADARAHWADHCAGCHANDGSGDTTMGKHMYPPAPDMRQSATQRLSDGELFFVIQNGVRFTGMPGWGGGSGHDEEDSWKLVRFIRHLPEMTVEERKQMEKLNPKSPDERKEEEEEENFLKGEGGNETPQHHH